MFHFYHNNEFSNINLKKFITIDYLRNIVKNYKHKYYIKNDNT